MTVNLMASVLFYLPSLFFFLLLLLHLLPTTIAQSDGKFNLGTSFSTSDENSSWISPSRDFAFGFHRLSGENFFLAIWFARISEEPTIVWCANRDYPVPKGSRVELTAGGSLVLFDDQGREIWNRNATATDGEVTYAAMLNTGNLALVGKDSKFKWESFNEPTDTILPTQILGMNSVVILKSRLKKNSFSKGRFQLHLQGDGNLVLYTVSLPKEVIYKPYWASNTVGLGYQLIFDRSGNMYLNLTNGGLQNLTTGDVEQTGGDYRRATLDFDGIFRQYIYQNKTWKSAGMSIPLDICGRISESIGSGACGFNSYCELDANQRFECKCPPGYAYINPSETYEGCKANFSSPSCDQLPASEKEAIFYMEEMNNTDWPSNDYAVSSNVDENQCKKECLEDCSCGVAIFMGGKCSKKKLPLSNGRMGSNIGEKALIKLLKSNYSSKLRSDSCKGERDQSNLILNGSLLLGSSVFINFILISAISLSVFYSYHKKLLNLLKDSTSMLGIKLRLFTYKQLEEATDGFKEELGRGAFGSVYKGILDSRNYVAVKKLHKVVQEGEKEFKAEVSIIGQTHHKNLVRLLGFCDEGLHRLLVYEFMSNGSLASFLFGISRPDWNQRTQIALGIARGLMYLHEECSTQIVHCDVKPQNVLLDDCFTARIADFGVAKILMAEQTRTSTGFRGTRGYLAPDWFKNSSITVKVDVYSFGVMLLEIICCRKQIKMEVENEEILAEWAYKCYTEGKLNMLMENDEEALNDMRRVERLVMVAIWCIQEEPSLRPSMKKVTQMLEGVLGVHVPPDPFRPNSFVPK